jgi:hypothetical protein
MQFVGIAVLVFAGLVWIVGGRAIMGSESRRPKPQSLISMLRPYPNSFKDLTQSEGGQFVPHACSGFHL